MLNNQELEKIILGLEEQLKTYEHRLGDAEVRIKDLIGITDNLGLKATTEVSSATPTINTDRANLHSITALAAAITSMTTNLSGNPEDGDSLIIRMLDNSTARAITWGAKFEDAGVALPGTTVQDKLLTVVLIYNSVTKKWGCILAVSET